MAYVIETEKGKFAGCSTSELYGTGENGSIMQQISFDSFVTRWHVSLAVRCNVLSCWVQSSVMRRSGTRCRKSRLQTDIGNRIWDLGSEFPSRTFILYSVQRWIQYRSESEILKRKLDFPLLSQLTGEYFVFSTSKKLPTTVLFVVTW